MPSTPSCSRALLTSSSTNGLTIAVISFIGSALLSGGRRHPGNRYGRRGAEGGGRTAAAQAAELVGALGVLGLVHAGHLGLGLDPESDGGPDEQPEEQRGDERVRQHRAGPDRLAP